MRTSGYGCQRGDAWDSCLVYCESGRQLMDGWSPVAGGHFEVRCLPSGHWDRDLTCQESYETSSYYPGRTSTRYPDRTSTSYPDETSYYPGNCPDLSGRYGMDTNDYGCRRARPGDSCRLSCRYGMILVDRWGQKLGSYYQLQCQYNGQWSRDLYCQDVSESTTPYPELTTDNPANCSDLSQRYGMDTSGYGCRRALPGDSCQLSCYYGMILVDRWGQLVGNYYHVQCQSNGEWSRDLYCQDKYESTTSYPENITGYPGQKCSNVYLHRGDWYGRCYNATDGDQCYITCQPGFMLMQYGWRQLDYINNECNGGYWNVSLSSLSCVERYGTTTDNPGWYNCPSLYPPNGGDNAGDCRGAYSGRRCLFACDSGRRLVGHSILTCQSYGHWDYDVPTCSALDCQSVRDPRTMETWDSYCERQERPCSVDPYHGPKCGCQEGLEELSVCVRKRKILQKFLNLVVDGKMSKR